MRTRILPTTAVLLVLACSSSVITEGGNDGGSSSTDGGGLGDGGTGGSDGGEACAAPHVLILLDRTGTMHRDLAGNTPPATDAGIESSKLYQAITALDWLVTKPGIDQSMQLGLAYFPRDPGGNQCVTLRERLNDAGFTNPACEAGQIAVPPAPGTGGAIANALDPETTPICFSTPTGKGLETALSQLQSNAQAGVKQYVMLVTDGADFYQSCPDPDPIVVLRRMEAAGVSTFIVGFGAQDTTPQGVNPPLLNRMACAGGTAKDFATSCEPSPDGGFDAVDAGGDRLYYDAANAAALEASLKAIASEICCNCIF